MDISYVSGQEKFNYRVCAVIISDGRILTMHDERSPYFYLPGGRVRLGETAEHAVVREVREELGRSLNLKDIRPHLSMNYERGFDDFYTVIQDVDLNRLVLQTSEVAEVRWASLQEVRLMEKNHTFVPYFSGLIDFLWQIRDNYDGAICQGSGATEV